MMGVVRGTGVDRQVEIEIGIGMCIERGGGVGVGAGPCRLVIIGDRGRVVEAVCGRRGMVVASTMQG